MKWRKIGEPEVEMTIRMPDRREETVFGRWNVYKRMGSRLIKVTYRDLGHEWLVISAVDKMD